MFLPRSLQHALLVCANVEAVQVGVQEVLSENLAVVARERLEADQNVAED